MQVAAPAHGFAPPAGGRQRPAQAKVADTSDREVTSRRVTGIVCGGGVCVWGGVCVHISVHAYTHAYTRADIYVICVYRQCWSG